ncbi:hypothetical protein AQUCO_02400047v1 [Aquilegia coerulea]|uniref:BED-type domain-containing protein n=1 Tax=Aquilegia coerulea TaxID=218851 RepID=A0A2G5DB07_AQUCA|nr:hypothetical protein AQUCO_02400047v1 [Aquilegia coerulea]
MSKSNRDFAWKYAREIEGDKNHYCLYCNRKSSGGISRLKHHLADFDSLDDENMRSSGASVTQPKQRGPMDAFVSSKPKQTTFNSAYKKELRTESCRNIGRLFYHKVLPFNTVNSPFWLPAINVILKVEVDDIDLIKEEHKKVWKQYGCSIMSDGWTDGKNRVLVNFFINSSTDTIKNGENMFKYLDAVVDEVGEENVIQVIIDNAANMKNVGKRLMEKRNQGGGLRDIGKMKVFKETLDAAKNAIKFIYGHSIILAMMREFKGNKEIIRLAITRFATGFLTLQSRKNGGKGKKQKSIQVVEDEEETQDVGAMDSGGFPNIDTIDHFDSDVLRDEEFGGISLSQPMGDDFKGVDSDEDDLN